MRGVRRGILRLIGWTPIPVWRVINTLYHRLPQSLRSFIHRRYATLVEADRTQRVAAQSAVPSSPPAGAASAVVNVLTPLFLDLDGQRMIYGGGERYLVELAGVVRALGYDVRVYQSGRRRWQRIVEGISVTGFDTGIDDLRLNRQFHDEVRPGALTVYHAFTLATPRCLPGAIGISHGIDWDQAVLQYPPAKAEQHRRRVLSAVQNLSRLVSVDTNTINWLRAIDVALAGRAVYLPNFVDVDVFRPRSGPPAHPGRMVVLFPRRLYAQRGFWLVAQIVPDILRRFPDVEFHFVGQANADEDRAVRGLVAQHPGAVRWDELPPERMPEAYQAADITLIPSVAAEGTSLSCLEAQACGNAVIATNVGGLPNIVMHEYNGLLIEPTAPALQAALERLIGDGDLRARLGARARDAAQAHAIDIWRERWMKILRELLPERSAVSIDLARSELPAVVFPAAPGVSWTRMKQRPHQIAEQLAMAGFQVYWEENRREEPAAGLHLVPAGELPRRRPVVVIHYPYHEEILTEFDDPIVVYDVLDDVAIHAASDERLAILPGRRARDYHAKLLKRAHIVTVSSRTLWEQIRRIRPDALFVPNGVDWYRFGGNGRIDIAPDLPKDGKPVVGYHGALGPWFDYPALEAAARVRPEYQFVLIGPVSDRAALDLLLRNCPNVAYLGERAYDQLPSYVAGFNAGILPFTAGPVTDGTRPLKVLECLAMAKPVAAGPMVELDGWPGVWQAGGRHDLAHVVDEALAQGSDPRLQAAMRTFARMNSWTASLDPLLTRIRSMARPASGS